MDGEKCINLDVTVYIKKSEKVSYKILDLNTNESTVCLTSYSPVPDGEDVISDEETVNILKSRSQYIWDEGIYFNNVTVERDEGIGITANTAHNIKSDIVVYIDEISSFDD